MSETYTSNKKKGNIQHTEAIVYTIGKISMKKTLYNEFIKYGIVIFSVIVCLGLTHNQCAAQKVALRYVEAGRFTVIGQIKENEWEFSKYNDKVTNQGKVKYAKIYSLEVRPETAGGKKKFKSEGFKKIDDDFIAEISRHNIKNGSAAFVYVHGLKNPGNMSFIQSVEVKRTGKPKIVPLTENNFYLDNLMPYKITVDTTRSNAKIDLFFNEKNPKKNAKTSLDNEPPENKKNDDMRVNKEKENKKKHSLLPTEIVHNTPQVDSWTKNLLLRFYNENGIVVADEIWKDIRIPFKISSSYENKKVKLTTPAGIVECKPENKLIRWANCSNELTIENTKDTDILFISYKRYRAKETAEVYQILNGDKGDSKTNINIPKLANRSLSIWTVQVLDREKNVVLYEQEIDMNNNTKLNRLEKNLTVFSNPGSIVLITDERYTYTQLVKENGKVTFQLPRTTEVVSMEIKKPGYFSLSKRYSLTHDINFEIKSPLEKIPKINFQNLKRSGYKNLEIFDGSLSDLKVIVKDSNGRPLLEEPFVKVYTPLPLFSNKLELIDEKGRLIFKGNRLQDSINLSPSAKIIDLFFILEKGWNHLQKNDLVLLIDRNTNQLIPGNDIDRIAYFTQLELAISGSAYKPITAYLCAKYFEPFDLTDFSPDPNKNSITIPVNLELRKPKVLIALSEYSTSNASYYAMARDILKIDLAEKLKKRKAIIGVLKKNGFQEIKNWGTEKPSFYGDTANVLEDLRRAANLISGQKNLCGHALHGRMIYIGGDPGIKEVPEDFPEFYVISNHERKSYPGVPGVPKRNWYQERDKTGILRTLENLL
jgi:hypothetical protein